MSNLNSMIKVAILDDYAKIALQCADWSVLDGKAEVSVFERHLTEQEAAVALRPFDVLCTVRERMSLPRSLFERLPNLKLVTIIGRIGTRMAEYGRAFGMPVIAWSQNLTDDAARAAGAKRVEKDDLFRLADVVSIHVRLSDRTRGPVTARELALMKPGAYLINTSRGPIVVEADLTAALRAGRIAGAGIDVFDEEPPPANHPFRTMDNVTVTPHLGYVTREALTAFYADTLEAVAAFANGAPIRVANPDALAHRKK